MQVEQETHHQLVLHKEILEVMDHHQMIMVEVAEVEQMQQVVLHQILVEEEMVVQDQQIQFQVHQ